MNFESAREEFVTGLQGRLIDGPDGSKNADLEVYWPTKQALDFLGTVNEPMDVDALDLLRDELPEDDYPNPTSAPLTWAQAVALIHKYQADTKLDPFMKTEIAAENEEDAA